MPSPSRSGSAIRSCDQLRQAGGQGERPAFLYTGREKGSFGVAIDLDTVEMLKDTDPETFWQSPHYEGWPAVLVRYGSEDPERVARIIERSHAWTAARPRVGSRKTK